MTRHTLALILASCVTAPSVHAEVAVVRNGVPVARIVVDVRESEGRGPETLRDGGEWLAKSIEQATGTRPVVTKELGTSSAIVLARADAWPDVAKRVKLQPDVHDAYAIVTDELRVYVLGNTEDAVRFGVTDLLHRWGFRWLAPSPRWHVVPEAESLAIDVTVVETPAMIERRFWYAYGMSGDDLKPLMQNYTRWATANRLGVRSRMRTGHSYGNIIGRNTAAFEDHPEFYALLPDGTRDNVRPVNARKFCYSDPGLIELVANDRLRLLEETRRTDPAAFMVSVDPSDGEGTCHSAGSRELGTTTDRVFHLANAVARRLREKHPDAWVGLYAYSSHRLPPTIDVEPNVYVQVAMGFNRTEYTLPELVEKWSEKVQSIGLREYYGVEAWDWGLPGRMRGGRVDYHAKWIPYYAERNVNAINAETNANWGGQSLGLYVASRLTWDPSADVEAIVEEYHRLAFGDVAETMRAFTAKMDAAPPLRASTLRPIFEDLESAWRRTEREDVRRRIVDLMAYLVYVAKYRTFDLVRSRHDERGDAYYTALRPLMEYAWRIRHRDVVHYYALARRLCNGLPLRDGRRDFYLADKERPPIWMTGDAYSDDEIRRLFEATLVDLRNDDDPTVAFSRLLDHVHPEGEDAGPSRILQRPETGIVRFRGKTTGWLVPRGRETVTFGIAPTGKRTRFVVFQRDEPLVEHALRPEPKTDGESAQPREVVVELPKAGEYRVAIEGECELHVPAGTPFVYEASVTRPAWVSYSGPHYFYVPQGTRELVVDAEPRLSLHVPGRRDRIDVVPADRVPDRKYAIVPVPEGADGKVWHTSPNTRGRVSLLNVPPLLSLHRETVVVPREVGESEQLSTKR